MQRVNLKIAGLLISIYLRYDYTLNYFQSFICNTDVEELDIVIPPVDLERLGAEISRLGGDRAFAEYSLLIEPLSNLLLKHDRFLFHGAAFLWHGKAFLFTGQSGVGKSTQLRHWLKLYPNEIEIINGDKPIFEVRGTDFIVHPSPWTGKENLSGTRSAPLGGIIYLEQGKENTISRLSAKEAVFPIFLQFLYKPNDLESVDLVCQYEEALLQRIPVWKLTNTGTPDSAQLTHQTLIEEGF